MARLFRLGGLGTRSTTGTRSEKTPKSGPPIEQAIPASRARSSQYSTDQNRNYEEGASSVGTKSVLSFNKDQSLSYIVLLCNSQTNEPIAIDSYDERIDNDPIPSRGRKLEKRDESTFGDDDEVRSRPACRQSDRTKSLRSGRMSMTRRKGRSLSKNRRDRSRSKSKKHPTRSTNENGKNMNCNNINNNDNRRRSMSRRQGKFVSNKKRWNLSLGSGRFLQPRKRSLSVDSRTKKKGGQPVMTRPSLTRAVSIDELIARQVTRDDTMDNHAGQDTTKDKYHPKKGYPIDDDEHSLIDGLNAVDQTYWRFTSTKRQQRHRDADTLQEIGSFDDSIYYGYKDGWLATYDRCLGTVCGFEVDDLPSSSEKAEESRKMNWKIKTPECAAVDSSCLLAEIRDDVVLEILGPTNEVKDPLTLDVDQKNDGLIEPL